MMWNDEKLLDFKLDCYENLIKHREEEEFKKAIAENRRKALEEQHIVYVPYITVQITPVSDYGVNISQYINKKVDESRYAKIIINDSLLA